MGEMEDSKEEEREGAEGSQNRAGKLIKLDKGLGRGLLKEEIQ